MSENKTTKRLTVFASHVTTNIKTGADSGKSLELRLVDDHIDELYDFMEMVSKSDLLTSVTFNATKFINWCKVNSVAVDLIKAEITVGMECNTLRIETVDGNASGRVTIERVLTPTERYQLRKKALSPFTVLDKTVTSKKVDKILNPNANRVHLNLKPKPVAA